MIFFLIPAPSSFLCFIDDNEEKKRNKNVREKNQWNYSELRVTCK